MNSKGIRIWDEEDGAVSVKLSDILEEIKNGDSFNWSILFLDAMGDLGKDRSIPEFQNQIIKSEKGFLIKWEELNLLSLRFEQIFQIIIIACSDKSLLLRYEEDQERYENCDISIELIDSYFWEVFSKDLDLINRLAKKFFKTEFLEPDYQKDFYR